MSELITESLECYLSNDFISVDDLDDLVREYLFSVDSILKQHGIGASYSLEEDDICINFQIDFIRMITEFNGPVDTKIHVMKYLGNKLKELLIKV